MKGLTVPPGQAKEEGGRGRNVQVNATEQRTPVNQETWFLHSCSNWHVNVKGERRC